jgi:shikimate dehydrogenase
MSASQVRIDGATRLFGIIGDPVAQVRSPEAMNPRFAAAGVNAVLVPLHVRPERFDETLRGLLALGNLDGLVVTVPYKARILPFLDRVLPTGRAVGAVNALRREPDGSWTGDMFDGRGLVRGLHARGHEVAGRRVMLLGAGGAGSAVAFAFAEAGAAAISIHDIDPGRAESLVSRLRDAYPACDARVAPPGTGYDWLVNATPVGMAADGSSPDSDRLPAEFGRLDPGLLVVDVIMKPEVTPLLALARACGCRTVGGRAMLEGQADELARFFRVGT